MTDGDAVYGKPKKTGDDTLHNGLKNEVAQRRRSEAGTSGQDKKWNNEKG